MIDISYMLNHMIHSAFKILQSGIHSLQNSKQDKYSNLKAYVIIVAYYNNFVK